MESSFQILWYFFSFFHLVCKLFKGLFQPLYWSVNCTSRVFQLCNIFQKCSEAIYGKFICTVCTVSDFFLVCKIMYYILEVPRYTNIVYIGVYLVLTYIEKLFSTACYFLIHFYLSVNCMNRVIKFHKFCLTCSEIEARFIFKDFQYCHLWNIQFFSVHFFSLFSSGL